jgi:hypothetical protein
LDEEEGALYQLERDPFELKDVSKARPDICKKLRAKLLATRELQEQRGREFGSGMEEDLDPKTLQDLRDLGYTGKD